MTLIERARVGAAAAEKLLPLLGRLTDRDQPPQHGR